MTTPPEAPPRFRTVIDPRRLALALPLRRPGGRRSVPRVPTPPRVMPSSKPVIQFSPQEVIVRASIAMVAVLVFGFLANVLVLSHVQHFVLQQQASDELRLELANGTAPVSEGDENDVLLADGAPVAKLDIGLLGIHEVVVEGTNSGTLKAGPGHRRDTVLPGQQGTSVIMGRSAAFGGPFSRIQELLPGAKFSVITGQGKMTFEVIGVRYAGDAAPPAPIAGESRLVLETARGLPFAPTGVARVDARLVGDAQPAGLRQTTPISLAVADRELASDTSTVWALVFALQLFLVVEVLGVWSLRRVGLRKAWVVVVPVALLTGLLVADQATRLLPNLL